MKRKTTACVVQSGRGFTKSKSKASGVAAEKKAQQQEKGGRSAGISCSGGKIQQTISGHQPQQLPKGLRTTSSVKWMWEELLERSGLQRDGIEHLQLKDPTDHAAATHAATRH